jgi:hypothetical protein
MISANTLFHFTKSIENIRNILTNNFKPRYCLERIDFIPNTETDIDLAIPMVCFCDIPLSQIINHVETYGNYAIGLRKEWAMEKSISPIIYLHNNSRTNNIINKLFVSTARIDGLDKLIKGEFTGEASLNLLELLFYCKIYKGRMWRDNLLIDNVTFYNEREWRYIPKLKELEPFNSKYIITKEEYFDESQRMKANKLLTDFQIHFTPKDIKYIIIKNESERIRMVRMIEEIKGNDFSLNELKELSSKIISTEQIKDDF